MQLLAWSHSLAHSVSSIPENSSKLENAINSNLDYVKGETLAIKLYFSENLDDGEVVEFDDIKTIITINKV